MKVAGYLHNICATIEPWEYLAMQVIIVVHKFTSG